MYKLLLALLVSLPLSAQVSVTSDMSVSHDVTVSNTMRAGAIGLAGDAFDDFNRSDRTLNGSTTPTGQIWRLTGPGAATSNITSGIMGGPSNTYYYLPLPSGGAKTIQGDSGFPSWTNTLLSGTLIMDVIPATTDTMNALNNCIHFQFNPLTWALSVTVGGGGPGSFVILASGGQEPAIARDGTPYRVWMTVVGNTVTMQTPDGVVHTVTDSRVGAVGTIHSGAWQTQDSTIIWYNTRLTNFKPTPSSSASSGISSLYGLYGQQRQMLSFTLPATVDWYRVATKATFVTFTMVGHVKISAIQAGVQAGVWEFDVNTIYSSTTPHMAQTFGGQSSMFDQARLSTDAGGFAIGLDLHLQAARVTTVYIEFIGQFTPILAPVGGATVLPTGNVILSFSAL